MKRKRNKASTDKGQKDGLEKSLDAVIRRPPKKPSDSLLMSLRLSGPWTEVWDNLKENLDHPRTSWVLKDGILVLSYCALHIKDPEIEALVERLNLRTLQVKHSR